MIDGDSGDEDDSIDSLLREAGRIGPLPAEPTRIGTRLGRFRIDEKLGQGGMGVVYAAEDVELGRRVALKLLPHAAVADEERRRRFLREARTAAAVSHPHLAAMFDVGEADGTVFLAMELVRGTTLRAKIGAAPEGMAASEARRIALQIARGLGKAHASNVVHRDLKPENVMVDAAGDVKIVDFGLAKLAAPRADAGGSDLSTQDGRILGTPSYMAPEQAKGSRVGPAADVFSLGVVLYEMLTGTRPFGGTSLVDVLVAIARDTPPPPSRRAPGVPRELDRIVLRCLAKEPAERFADGDAVAAALEAVGRPAGERPMTTWLLAAAGGLILGGIAFFFMHHTPTASSSSERARALVEPASGAAEPRVTEPRVTEPRVTEPAPPEPSAPRAPPSASSSPGASSPRPVAARPPAAPASALMRSASSTPRTAPPAVDPLARQK